jgi:hypothetical protein
MRAGFLLRRRNQCGVALAVPQWRQKFASERCGFRVLPANLHEFS